MKYNLMIPPLFMKPIYEMNDVESKAYYDWFIKEIPNRIELLRIVYSKSGYDGKDLDFTSCSLQNLWKWYASISEQSLVNPDAQIEEINNFVSWGRANRGEYFYPYIREKYFINLDQWAVAFDICLYLSLTLEKNYDYLKWGVYKPACKEWKIPAGDEIVVPTLTGFKYDVVFNPWTQFHFLSHYGDPAAEYLLSTYNQWIELVDDETDSIPLGPYYTWDEQADYIINKGFPYAFNILPQLLEWAYDANSWGANQIIAFLKKYKTEIILFVKEESSKMDSRFEKGFIDIVNDFFETFKWHGIYLGENYTSK